MWPFESSSFSKTMAWRRDASALGMSRMSCAMRSASSAAEWSTCSFSFVWILGAFEAWNGATTTSASMARTAAGSWTGSILNMNARRFAAAMMKPMWTGSSGVNSIGDGMRFVPAQNGCPASSFLSGGSRARMVRMRWLKSASNLLRANATHDAKSTCAIELRMSKIDSSMSRFSCGCLAVSMCAWPWARNWTASTAALANVVSKSSRASWMQWSIMYGKLWSVHCGVSFSGGSGDEP
eukprot:Amastigsp_a843731_23.p3 type:complete len:238 gc:universal Amastigsp_a843731_23:694-1407(+)